jgi:hypothetical protein
MNQVPSKSGYYWRKGRDEDDTIVTQVVEVGPLISTMPDELFYWVPGEIGAIYVGADSEWDTKWFGPVLEGESQDAIMQDMSAAMNLILDSGLDVESVTDGVKQLLQWAQPAPIITGGLDDTQRQTTG